ncbi:PolC-type DNA polymerase III [Oceanirhabdus seepicola]|uniref:DNA polymerase III PolC-type n=1 Tax=Oceanirhabdus seepicola TaxID=2828781 RepID=A0A9J6P4U2_9CLOT|nr:PolC-type DNA polymerase III [Oceanirhabdus seepicola]MCM1991113.1 PolC-type DNA polymerase III [Oceanirhabdus seepicola]
MGKYLNELIKLKEDGLASILSDVEVCKVVLSKKTKRIKVELKHNIEIDEIDKQRIERLLEGVIPGSEKMQVLWFRDISGVTLEEVCQKYWSDLLNTVGKTLPVCKGALLNCAKEISGDSIKISLDNEFLYNKLKDRRVETFMRDTISSIFGVSCSVELLHENKGFGLDEYRKSKENQNKYLVQEVFANIGVNPQKDSSKKEEKKPEPKKRICVNSKSDDKSVILGRSITIDSMNIIDIDETSGVVAIEGEVFAVNIKETRTGKKILMFNITDYTSSITVKIFLKPKDEEAVLEEVKKGFVCKVRGEALLDTFSREIVVMGRDISKLQKIEKMDTASEKRVELHLHTQMSSMDAVVSASDVVKRAAKWGHKAVAITDHGVAQAFPEAMDAAKKHGIKIIYGIEGYLVNDGEPIVLDNFKVLKEETIHSSFVVFDLETTGFSPKNDRIIEIGAVKIQEGKIIDRFNVFVNPERKIPFDIIELTGINNDMVRDAKTIEEVMPEFLEFTDGAVVVAHNAAFDCSFINTNCNRLDLEFKNATIDTVALCKYVIPELKTFKLKTIAKHLKISLDNHHRAVDDAEATAEIFLHCFKNLNEVKGLKYLKDINTAYSDEFNVLKAPTHHIILFAKNQVGLKNIYKMISKSNLDYFFRRPRMPKSMIMEHREGVIIGSACEAGELYKAFLAGKSKDDLKEIASFYDYLEIQPTGNNEFMIRKGIVNGVSELQEINKAIYELGLEMDKPVVATGDVHFLDPHDEVYRKILMVSKGFSDAEYQPPLYFKTTDEMLKEFRYLGSHAAYDVVVKNTNKVSDWIEMVKPIPDETFTPKIEGAEEELESMCWEKARNIYGENLPEIVSKRLKKELTSIIGNGYAVLYLIAQKLVAKSYQDGYLVGSRGSVGSSFAATMSDITEVNGLPPHYVCRKCKYSEFITDGSVGAGVDMEDKECPKCGEMLNKDGFDIPFETFLGFEGDKEPDIDLNFSGDNQGDIHRYCEVLFGKGYTFKAGTIGTVADKTAYGYVMNYLKDKDMILPGAEVDRLSKGLTGAKRTSGQHPGGIMVVPSDQEIFNFCPIQHPADDPTSDIITTHFDYHSISGRLLKLDILGHDDPTVLRMLKDITGIEPQSVPLGDEKVLSLFTSTKGLGITEEDLGCPVGCYGIPEFGTKFVRQMLLDTKPKTFSDLVRISGLSHGTDVWLNNAQYFIKEGYTTLKDCISTRDDIMVYLIYKGVEPAIAFTIMEKVRKGKGVSEEYEKVMKENNVPDWYIESCKRIKYMFPKGHAAAYVMMAIRIAYFKVYKPQAYYCAYLTIRADEFDGNLIIRGQDAVLAKMEEINNEGNAASNKDKGLLTTLELVHEMRLREIEFLPVDLYISHPIDFTIEDGKIRMPLSAIEGVGENAAKSMGEARKNGEFLSKEDLRKRAKVTKTVIEGLNEHGCLKGMPESNQLSFF